MEENKKNKIPNVPNLRFKNFYDGWLKKELKNICNIRGGYSFSLDFQGQVSGEIPFYKVSDMNNIGNETFMSKSNNYLTMSQLKLIKAKPFPKDTLIFAKVGAALLLDRKRITTRECLIDNNMMGMTLLSQNEYNIYFLYLQLLRQKFAALSRSGALPSINASDVGNLSILFPSIVEQNKISTFLKIVDERIEAQNKIIDKYESLIKQINNNLFCREDNSKIGDFIQEISKRNKDGAITNVLSVSNKNGFVKQSEQFEEKELASEDKTNYKIVRKGDFAFNPARINVGSIALLKNQEIGIVSPMYICFKPKNIPDYILESYFLSSSFKKQMNKRLEGSVRMCLTIDGMKNIRFHNLDKKELEILNILLKLRSFVFLNKKILNLYCLQKNYLLSNLFI